MRSPDTIETLILGGLEFRVDITGPLRPVLPICFFLGWGGYMKSGRSSQNTGKGKQNGHFRYVVVDTSIHVPKESPRFVPYVPDARHV